VVPAIAGRGELMAATAASTVPCDSQERRLLEVILLCTLADRNASARKLLPMLARGDLDWPRLWELALHHEVFPLVAQTLTDERLAPLVPTFDLEEAQSLLSQTTLVNLSLHAEFEKIRRALRDRDVPVAPLKGTHLAERLYDSIGLRRAGDIDILVPEAAVGVARQTLQDRGYRFVTLVSAGDRKHPFHSLPLTRPGKVLPFIVELHWKLSDPRFVTIDYRHLWGRIDAVCADRPHPSLPGEELLLFLALHRFKHDTGWLRLLADIDRLVRREGPAFDWSYVVSEATRWGIAAMLYFALDQSQTFLRTPLPDAVLPALRPNWCRRRPVATLLGGRGALCTRAADSSRSNRHRLAYCLMLRPLSRTVKAYFQYLFPWPETRRPGWWGTVAAANRRIAGGVVRTVLILASLVVDR
jgi:hypothetical protein